MSVMSRDIKEIAYLEEIGWFEPTLAEQFQALTHNPCRSRKQQPGGEGVVPVMSRDMKE